jgi:hypothetical protein
MNRRDMLASLGLIAAAGTAGADDTQTKRHAGNGPMAVPHAHFCGIHMFKKNPKIQFTTQHYCVGQGEGVHQCTLYDGTGPTAKLIGIEYLITDELYQGLPDEEKRLWHPHTYEVLAGGLIAPGMNETEEHKFMSYVLKTWGKAWHTWPDPSTKIPMGEPMLIWSLMGDGQADEKVVAARDKEFGISTAAVRKKRIEQFKMEPPQVSLPKDMNYIGRMWTDNGPDQPKKK